MNARFLPTAFILIVDKTFRGAGNIRTYSMWTNHESLPLAGLLMAPIAVLRLFLGSKGALI